MQKLLLGFSFFASTFSLAQEPLRFLVGESWAMPFSEIVSANNSADKILKRGIIFDWQNAIAAELGSRAAFVMSSRNREDSFVEKGLVDLRCFITPDWVSDQTVYDWPKPLYRIQEILVGSSKVPLIQTVTELQGKNIGTVLGYHYKALQPLFDAGTAIRDDAPNEVLNLKKQLVGRTDYLVMRLLDFQYQQKIDPKARSLRASPLVVENQSIYCAIPKNGRLSLGEYEAAQAKLLKAGEFEKILARYH